MSRRIPDSIVAAWHADYMRGASLSEIGRRCGRDRRVIREHFENRGLWVRPSNQPKRPRVNGQFVAYKPMSPKRIEELIAQAKKLTIPLELKWEWRKWPLERRGEFIARLRAKLQLATERPTTAFSANVEPFDYASPRAWEIVNRMNAGTNSQYARIKLDISSQGVIWNSRLWFWCHKVGYQSSGPWTPDGGRPSLHKTIWEQTHGRHVPPGHVVIFADGNKNNFTPENLKLHTRDFICRGNQAAALTRKSREMMSILLNSNQGDNNGTGTIAALKSL